MPYLFLIGRKQTGIEIGSFVLPWISADTTLIRPLASLPGLLGQHLLSCVAPLLHPSKPLSSFPTHSLCTRYSHGLNALPPVLNYLLIFISQLKCLNFNEPTLIPLSYKTSLLFWLFISTLGLFSFSFRTRHSLNTFINEFVFVCLCLKGRATVSHSPCLPGV